MGTTQRDAKRKNSEGGGVGVESLLSPSPPPYFFFLLSLNLCFTPLSEWLPVVSIQVVLIQVNSLKVYIVLRTWLKKRKIINIHPKCFSCSIAHFTWSDRNFCAISLLEFASKRLVSERLYIETTGFHLNAWNRQKGSVSSVLKWDVKEYSRLWILESITNLCKKTVGIRWVGVILHGFLQHFYCSMSKDWRLLQGSRLVNAIRKLDPSWNETVI